MLDTLKAVRPSLRSHMPHDGLNKALYKTLPERHHGLIPLNMEAVEAGGQIIEKV